MVRLISFIGVSDSDLIPFFLAHYRPLGVSEFHLFLHGSWMGDELVPLRAADLTIAGMTDEPYADSMRGPIIGDYARGFLGDWLIVVDPDEFLELPYPSLKRTIAALSCLGAEELPASLLQRVSAEGRLPARSDGATLDSLFPCLAFRPTERMDVLSPIWKSRYPLVRVGERFSLLRGNHLPHAGRATAHLPIRGVVHHFNWRDRLLRSIKEKRGAGSNQDEIGAHRRWREANDCRVPSEGLQSYSRALLFDLGYLVRPNRVQLKRLAAVRKLAEGRGSEARRSHALKVLTDTPSSLAQPADAAMRYLDRTSLERNPGKIAIVTSHLVGPTRTSGIGTAMSALAERLAAAGHDVHVVFCPHRGEPILEQTWTDYWAARGVVLHYFPRSTANHRLPLDKFITALSIFLDCYDWDVIHFHEARGHAAAPLLLRASGLRFTKSKVVVTVHAPTRWHRAGDYLPWNEDEALQSHFEALSLELADLVVYPSRYIRDWCRRHFPSTAPYVFVPNAMTGETRRFGPVKRARRAVRKVVFFGRIELRKGIDVFLEAIEGVLRAGKSDFEVIFLGRFGESVTKEQLELRIASWACQATIISDHGNADAIDLLRSEECLVVVPSRTDNVPFTVYECLENGIPILTSGVGGIAEMIGAKDHETVIVDGGAAAYTARILDALANGISPASLSFDPGVVDIDLLAVHARLVAEARTAAEAAAPKSKATVILHGSAGRPETKPLQKTLKSWIRDGVEVLADLKTFTPTSEPADAAPSGVYWKDEHAGEACNRLAAMASEDVLLFCRSNVAPFPESITAMMTLLQSTRADAAVCGYRTVDGGGAPIDVPAFGSPPELSTLQNGYGYGLLMVRKQSFFELGGFAVDREVAPIMEWEFLNRLRASGRRLVAVPIAMALVPEPIEAPEFSERAAGRLAAPWTVAAPPHLQGLVRMGVHPARSWPATISGMSDRQAKPEEIQPSAPPVSSPRGMLGSISLRPALSNLRSRFSGAVARFAAFAARKDLEGRTVPADASPPASAAERSAEQSAATALARQAMTVPEPATAAPVAAAAMPADGGTAPGQISAGLTTEETHAPAEPILWDAESPLNDILASDAAAVEASEEHVRLGDRPFDGANAYWITSASDAEGCDFLVRDNLLAPGQSEELCRDLLPLWERPRLDSDDQRSGLQAITLVEVLADRPKAGRLLHDALQRSLELTRGFYRLRRPLRPAAARIVRRGSGALSFAPIGEEPLDPRRLSFEGVLYLNNGYQAGARLFPALSIAVKPASGMLVATTRSPSHRSVVQTVTSGSQLTLEFMMELRE
jgi:glycosyltransferase involved in cell wall biosynthesis